MTYIGSFAGLALLFMLSNQQIWMDYFHLRDGTFGSFILVLDRLKILSRHHQVLAVSHIPNKKKDPIR